jgi:hypothetical protein
LGEHESDSAVSGYGLAADPYGYGNEPPDLIKKGWDFLD